MKTSALVWTLILVVNFTLSQDLDRKALRFLPTGHMIPVFRADATAHYFAATRIFEEAHINTAIGGVFPVVETDYLGLPIQLSVGASVHTHLNTGQSIAVITTEFYVDFLLVDIAVTKDILARWGMGHTSHHLGDNAFNELQRTKPHDYSRDYTQLLLVYKIGESAARVYGGANYGYDFVIDRPVHKPWVLQMGGEAVLFRFDGAISTYAAADVKIRQELSFGSTQSYQLGINVHAENEHALRLAYTLTKGMDERGQFFGERLSWNTIGIILDL